MDVSKKEVIKYVIYFIIFLFIIVLCFIFSNNKNELKLYKQFDYVYGKNVSYTNDGVISDLPFININSLGVNEINKEIAKNYYNVVVNDASSYYYSYYIYNDIVSLLIVTSVSDDSEYGNINYYGYNVRISDGAVLDNDLLLNFLNIDRNYVLSKVDEKLKEFYNIDSLNSELEFNEYKNILMNNEDFVYVFKDDILYAYKVINYTHDIVNGYNGNIYEYYIMDLK